MIIIPTENEKYDKYISRIIESRFNERDESVYQENHHILPKCMDGTNEMDNLVWLYQQEHYYAHKLLHEKYPDNVKLSYAWWNICTANKNGRHCHISEDEYAEARRIVSMDVSINRRGKNNSNFNGHFSEDHRLKISIAKTGKKFTEDHIKNISKFHADVNGDKNPRATKLKCIESGIIFNTIAEASSYYNINRNAIRKYLNGSQNYAGVDKQNNIKLHWELLS